MDLMGTLKEHGGGGRRIEAQARVPPSKLLPLTRAAGLIAAEALQGFSNFVCVKKHMFKEQISRLLRRDEIHESNESDESDEIHEGKKGPKFVL